MSAPTWSRVDDDTNDLLTLVADRNLALDEDHDSEWHAFLGCLLNASADSTVDPNRLRDELRFRDVCKPQRVGAFVNRAKAAGYLEDTGEWVVSDDRAGRNGGKPCRVYRLTTAGARAALAVTP